MKKKHTKTHLLSILKAYVSDDDITLTAREFLEFVRDRITDDLAAPLPKIWETGESTP